ncbi:beta-defensin 5-like [Mus caroli]|uniref:Beta-defensin 5-like n=1 Tax=Mus caroli TaxID=10089 RepID=A0A6P5P4T6_MUSCR|nr:beta-defensin 5-like [Mus caroli]
MRIHHLLFAFLLVLLSPLAGEFTKKPNNPVSCCMIGGICRYLYKGKILQNGSYGVTSLNCSKRK